ncbi:hypothetical protein OH76DRAFT_1489380 [Lentinus brumalis]|uniref:Uncharacterized protein n=1 Tax=Lentinus brumalis TaxID=2498619 RepID=A0A371CMQ1_9APHY|nr:hypothetical protein OH76DRAFT_1489380 [Polyporus brumalis]
MARNNQNSDLHPNGQRLIALRDVKRVYGHRNETPYRMYSLSNPRPTSMVTAKQVRDASDRWDAEIDEMDAWSVLEDIDTQWGALPEGGALEGYGSD